MMAWYRTAVTVEAVVSAQSHYEVMFQMYIFLFTQSEIKPVDLAAFLPSLP